MRCRWCTALLIALIMIASDSRALPQPLPECYAVWLFHGRNFERGDDPDESLLEAQQAFDEYNLQMSRIDVDDLDLGILQGRIESAMRLVGQEDSAAGYLRGALENNISQYSADVWPGDVLARPCGLVDAVVHFSDGTTVRLEPELMSIDFFSREFIGFDFQVDEDSLTGPTE